MSRPTFRYENQYKKEGFKFIAGLDEAGKGAWAGPVVAAAVVLPEQIDLPNLNDSKLVKAAHRDELFDLIQQQALAYGVGIMDATDVDELGLAQAHRMAMNSAVEQLSSQPDLLLVDGKGIRGLCKKSICIVKGDQKSKSIAAASILAKVTRDRLMIEYHEQHPQYQFCDHKGYGTKVHQEALKEHGPSILHRLSYNPVAQYFQASIFDFA